MNVKENGEITLIALPLHVFQQQNENNSLVVEQNLFVKTLNDGSYVIDTTQVCLFYF